MFNRLIQYSLSHRKWFIVLALILALFGIHSWLNLPIDAFPDISPTQAKVILKIPGMTPEEVEQRVVRPIEIEMLSIPHKTMVRSISKYGIADITIDFEENTDIYWARQRVSENLANLIPNLPKGTTGGLAPITTPLSELYMFTVESKNLTLQEKRRLLDWTIRPELRTIAGVADVNALGGEVISYEVIPDFNRMAAKKVSINAIRETLNKNNSNDGAGRIEKGEETLVVRSEGAIRSIEDIKKIAVHSIDNKPIMLDEIATVRMGSLTRYGAVTKDGQGEAVEGIVLGLRGVNARDLVNAIEIKLNDIQSRLPEGVHIVTFYNRGDLVSRAANNVIKALIEAAVLVCITLYFFLGGLRAAFVVAITLPLSILSTFIFMRLFGVTANLMSLGGLAIALGMLVDASVVVVENIEKAFSEKRNTKINPFDLIYESVNQVKKPLIAGVLIIAIVFLPLLSLEGLEGKLFSPVAKTIVMALFSSLFIAFSIVPALSSILLVHDKGAEPKFMLAVHHFYVRAKNFLWQHVKLLYISASICLVIAIVLYTFIGKIFMPTLDEGDILVQLQKLPSISLNTSVSIDTKIQQDILKNVSEVKSVIARVGSDELGLDPMGLNETDTFLVLKPKKEWKGNKDDIILKLRSVLDSYPDVIYSLTQPIEMRVSEMLTGVRGDLAVKVYGSDYNLINVSAQKIANVIRKIKGASEVIAPRSEGLQYLTVKINSTIAGQAGLSVEEIQQTLRNQIEGENVGIVLDGLIRTPLMIKGNDSTRTNPEIFKNYILTGSDGSPWPISSLAEISQVDGPIRIDHEQSNRYAVVQANVDGRDLTSFVEEAKQSVIGLNLPKELQITWGGQFENQQRAQARLALVIPIALVLIFIILMITFDSAIQACIIFLNIPFALVGGVLALAISKEYLSVPASVGFIALLGIAVLNGVVMVTHFNERLLSGESMSDAINLGSERRLRPILMTAVITALGMIPLLFSTGPGSEIQRPLAIVVIGGIITSTLLTLLLLPKIFERFCAIKLK